MKGLKLLVFAACLLALVSLPTFGQATIPAGTILPVTLTSGISAHARPGNAIEAKIMQDVPLPGGAWIRAGSRVFGTVVTVVQAKNGSGPELTLQFNKLVLRNGKTVPVTTSLRALASYVEVEAAQIPDTGSDRATPEEDRTTVLIGGDVDYRGGGPVMEGATAVGRPTANGVLSEVSAKPGSPCEGETGTALGLQALWVFSADACGVYGMPHIAIQHMGRSSNGQFVLTGDAGQSVKIAKGTGMLLTVLTSGQANA